MTIFFYGCILYAQDNKFLIGKWTVEEVTVPKDSIPKDKENEMKIIIDAFKKSSFQFFENGKFVFDFLFEDMKITNANWTYNSNNKTILITEVKNVRSNLMIIKVDIKSNNETYFYLEETPIILKVKK